MTELEVSIKVEASPATVFRYFTDRDRLLQWQGVSAEIDPRPGGIYKVDVTGRDVAVGEFVEVVPDERVVFTWGWEGNDGVPPGSSTVEVTLTPQGDDTIVKLRHFGLPDEDAAKQHTEGWDHYLERLQVVAAGGDPGRDSYLDLP